jgi:hypothetical protein
MVAWIQSDVSAPMPALRLNAKEHDANMAFLIFGE